MNEHFLTLNTFSFPKRKTYIEKRREESESDKISIVPVMARRQIFSLSPTVYRLLSVLGKRQRILRSFQTKDVVFLVCKIV